MKTIIPIPSSIWETFSLLHPYVHINVVLNLLLYKWQDLWQSHITKLSNLRPTRSWSTSNCTRCGDTFQAQDLINHLMDHMLLKLYYESRNAIHLVSMQQHTGSPGDPVLPFTVHWTLHMHTEHCTLPSSSCYLVLLVTDPPNANLNHLQNPPLSQTTTF